MLQLTQRSHFERVRSKIADMLLFSRPHFQQPLARIRGCVDRMKEQPMLALTPRLQASPGACPCKWSPLHSDAVHAVCSASLPMLRLQLLGGRWRAASSFHAHYISASCMHNSVDWLQ